MYVYVYVCWVEQHYGKVPPSCVFVPHVCINCINRKCSKLETQVQKVKFGQSLLQQQAQPHPHPQSLCPCQSQFNTLTISTTGSTLVYVVELIALIACHFLVSPFDLDLYRVSLLINIYTFTHIYILVDNHLYLFVRTWLFSVDFDGPCGA